MVDFAIHYGSLGEDELLQLWADRAHLTPEAESALWEEIEKRHISEQARKQVPPQEVTRKLAPPVETFINLSVLYWWLREIWLRFRCRHGASQPARVESTRETEPAYRSAARAELRYSYEFEGRRYSGRTVRDFMFSSRAADALVFGHKHGQAISVQLDPKNPGRSYYPSGFGSIQALIVGLFAVGIWGILLLFLVSILFPKLL